LFVRARLVVLVLVVLVMLVVVAVVAAPRQRRTHLLD
jgi:hypothetical protein